MQFGQFAGVEGMVKGLLGGRDEGGGGAVKRGFDPVFESLRKKKSQRA